MCQKNNRSNSRRQVVNINISPKVSPLEKFKEELFKLSKGNGKEIINHTLCRITEAGKLNESQEDMGLYLGMSKKSVSRALKLARKLKILVQKKTQHFWDNRKRGKDIHFLGASCFNLEKLKAISEVFPILKNYYEIYHNFVMKKGLPPSRKLGVTALKSNLNNNPYILIPNSSPNIKKECACARRKVCEKWTPPPGEKLPTKLVKKTDEEISSERDNLVKFFRENKFSKFLPPDVVNSLTNRATSSIASHKYV